MNTKAAIRKKISELKPDSFPSNYTKWLYEHNRSSGKHEATDAYFACIRCWGLGRIYHPDSQSDPAEGNKFREKINCTSCGGSGQFHRDYGRAKYKEEYELHKRNRESWKNEAAAAQSALRKLTKEELDSLLLFS